MSQADKRCVLLVDNDEDALKLYGDMLAEYEYNVLVARDGQEALQLFLEHHPHVVVTDVHMPEMNGEELFHQIMAVAPDTKVIFITGWSDIAAATRLVKSGAFDYLDKPVSLIHLVGVIKNAFIAHDDGAHSPKEETVEARPTDSAPNLQPVYVSSEADDSVVADLKASVKEAICEAQVLAANGELPTAHKESLEAALNALKDAANHLSQID